MTDNLEKMLASGRDDAMLRVGLGSAYFNSGDFERVVHHLEQCIEQDETYSAAYKFLGKALFKLGRKQEAHDVFARGLDVALAAGDKQTEREVRVFLKKSQRDDGDL